MYTKTRQGLQTDARTNRQSNHPTTAEWERIRQELGEPGVSHFKRFDARGGQA